MEIEFLQKGGIVMYPILVCSIFSLAIIIERFFSYWKTKKLTGEFLNRVNVYIKSDKMQQALDECEKVDIPISAIFKSGLLNRHKDRAELKSIIEEIGALEAVKLERFLPGLATIGTVSPLLGLLGTVTGMVTSFNAIAATTGVGETPVLAAGIAEALLTTVFGLCVAIPTVVAYNYFSKQVDNIILTMERSSIDFVDVLMEINNKVVNDLIKEGEK